MADGDNNLVRFSELKRYDGKIKEYINSKIVPTNNNDNNIDIGTRVTIVAPPDGDGYYKIYENDSSPNTHVVAIEGVCGALLGNNKKKNFSIYYDFTTNKLRGTVTNSGISNVDIIVTEDTNNVIRIYIQFTQVFEFFDAIVYTNNSGTITTSPTEESSVAGTVKSKLSELAADLLNYSSIEQFAGIWFDGSDIYKRTFVLDPIVNVSYTTWTKLTSELGENTVEAIIKVEAVNEEGTCYALHATKNHIRISSEEEGIYGLAARDNMKITIKYLTLWYTKTKYRIATPIMTSNTTPSGVVTASSTNTNNAQPYVIFNQNVSSTTSSAYWCGAENDTVGAWVKYEFPAAKIISRIKVYNRNITNNTYMPSQFKLQGSNNDSDWTDLITCDVTYPNIPAASEEWTFTNTTAYKYYRLYVTQTNFNYVCFGNVLLKELITSES